MIELLHWPATPENDLAPWYRVGWRLLWCPLIYGGMVITWTGLLLAVGYTTAKGFWKEAMA